MSRKPETINFWNGRLPHWEVTDGRYFVTIHLHGAIPQLGQDRIHAIAAELDKLPKEQQDQPKRSRTGRGVNQSKCKVPNPSKQSVDWAAMDWLPQSC